MNPRKAFPHLSDDEYAELLADIAKGTPEQKLARYELYVQAVREHGHAMPIHKALADLLYIEVINSDPALLDSMTKIGETE